VITEYLKVTQTKCIQTLKISTAIRRGKTLQISPIYCTTHNAMKVVTDFCGITFILLMGEHFDRTDQFKNLFVSV
jgi:hypothetical protein